MIICCTGSSDLCQKFSCKVENTDKGILISLEGDDPKQVEALQKMVESCQTLCCESEKKENCC